MENPTSFDLSYAIQEWREDLAQSPAFRGKDLDELASHLRDSTVALQTVGLSAEEAFMIAAKRTGTSKSLIPEFAKVNSRGIWLDRLLWMLIGFQAWMILSIAYLTTQVIAQAVLGWTVQGKSLSGASELGFYLKVMLFPPALCALALVLGWRLLKRVHGNVGGAVSGWLLKPLRLTLTLLLAAICFRLLADGLMYYWVGPVFYGADVTKVDSKVVLHSAVSLLPSAAGAVLIWILACKRLRLLRL